MSGYNLGANAQPTNMIDERKGFKLTNILKR